MIGSVTMRIFDHLSSTIAALEMCVDVIFIIRFLRPCAGRYIVRAEMIFELLVEKKCGRRCPALT